MEERDLTEMTGEGEPGSWLLAKKCGRKHRDMEASGSNAASLGSPFSACTSLHLLPEAKKTRKAVLRVRCFSEDCLKRFVTWVKSREDQEEAPEGGPVRGLGLRQICTPDEISEERITRKGGPTHLTGRGADSRPVYLDRGCWKTLVAGQEGQEVCQATRRRVMRWNRMIRTRSDPTSPMHGVYTLSAWTVSMLHQAEHRGERT